MRLRHHAAADDHSLGRQRQNPVEKTGGEILRFRFPSRMVRGQIGGFAPPALLYSGSGGEPFQAGAMKLARAFECAIMRNQHMSHLGMTAAMQHPMVDNCAAADASADRDVEKGMQTAGRAPLQFAQRGAVDVGIETDGHTESVAQNACYVEVLPARLGCIRDMAVEWRIGMGIDGPKAADAAGGDFAAREEPDNAAESLPRLGGRKLGAIDIAGAGADAAYELGTACFHRAVKWHFEFGMLKVYMKSITPLPFFLLASTAILCLAQEPPKPTPGTPSPKAEAEALAETAAKVPADAVVLSVGDEKLTRTQYENLIKELPEQAQKAAAGPNRRKVAEQLADLKAMAQEARKLKIDQEPGVQQLIRLQVDQALASLLFKDLQKNAKTDEASVRAFYDSHKALYEEAKASHILIRFQGSSVPVRQGQKDLTDAEALAKATEIRKKLVAGGSFSDMAKAESDDTGSGANGGSLGTFGHGQMVPEFEKAAFSAPVGQISEPIKTKFGYHLIKVDERKSKTFDEVKDEIAKEMKPQEAQKEVENIRKTGGIVINDDYFGK